MGAEYDGGTVPEGYEIFDIPAATWAVFGTEGMMPHAMQKLWHKIFAEFFPTSDYRPDKNFDLEVYSSGDMNCEDYHSEIWIAVTKK
ncbi:MAG: GyrI-like domain-containing protein [Eubacterium sp.]